MVQTLLERRNFMLNIAQIKWIQKHATRYFFFGQERVVIRPCTLHDAQPNTDGWNVNYLFNYYMQYLLSNFLLGAPPSLFN